jgi:2-oxoglutarate ferredoxin oxidoreductase subunit alpha
MALKGEGMGLAVSIELPLVIVDIQRGGPSTGLPTKTEQATCCRRSSGATARRRCR